MTHEERAERFLEHIGICYVPEDVRELSGQFRDVEQEAIPTGAKMLSESEAKLRAIVAAGDALRENVAGACADWEFKISQDNARAVRAWDEETNGVERS